MTKYVVKMTKSGWSVIENSIFTRLGLRDFFDDWCNFNDHYIQKTFSLLDGGGTASVAVTRELLDDYLLTIFKLDEAAESLLSPSGDRTSLPIEESEVPINWDGLGENWERFSEQNKYIEVSERIELFWKVSGGRELYFTYKPKQGWIPRTHYASRKA